MYILHMQAGRRCLNADKQKWKVQNRKIETISVVLKFKIWSQPNTQFLDISQDMKQT